MQTLTRAYAKLGRIFTNKIKVGTSGTDIKQISIGTVALDPASLAALTKANTDFTLTGAADGDVVLMVPPSDLEDDLLPCGAVVTAANTVSVYLYNGSDSAVDGAEKTWTYIWLDLT